MTPYCEGSMRNHRKMVVRYCILSKIRYYVERNMKQLEFTKFCYIVKFLDFEIVGNFCVGHFLFEDVLESKL